MQTLEVIGIKNFSSICKEEGLNLKEKQILKRILEKWDKLMKVEDSVERFEKKTKVALEELAVLSPERKRAVLIALMKINCLFLQMRLNEIF